MLSVLLDNKKPDVPNNQCAIQTCEHMITCTLNYKQKLTKSKVHLPLVLCERAALRTNCHSHIILSLYDVQKPPETHTKKHTPVQCVYLSSAKINVYHYIYNHPLKQTKTNPN